MRALLVPALALLLVAAADVPPEQETEHVVKPGETLMGVAKRAKVPRVLIAEAHRLKPPYSLRAGQTLKIPRTRRHNVARGDSGFMIAYRYGVPWRDIAIANGIDVDKPLPVGSVLLIPTLIAPPPEPADAPAVIAQRFAWPIAGPLAGKVRRGFRSREEDDYHDGIDIRTAEGTAVRAAAAGKVVFAGREPRQFGNLVVIDHGNGWNSAYAFLSRVTVKKDEDVRAGERVGLSGKTGLAKGPELHFELRRNNRPVDPVEQLPEGE
jgi:murein DD-endopeptidase MepM/ murein hydrolase activator NlpD